MMVFGCDAYVHVPKEKRIKLDRNLKGSSLLGITMV